MSETENDSVKDDSVKISDKRRFDLNGEPRRTDEDEVAAKGAAPDVEEAARVVEPPPEDPQALELRVTKEELEAARKRVDELARAYQALNREREEFKQRLTRERERMLDVERGNVAITLLEAIDELELALQATAEDTSPLAQGVRLIRDNLLAKLQSTGIERLETVGREYDPNLAEAADMEMTDQEEDDQRVVSEVRAGYRLKDRIVRPARVKVAKYVRPAQA